jgi:2-oxoglutarate dehydrogenase E2 component (dihydrolipoamide succinyltransferase)
MAEVRLPKPGDAITEATIVALVVADGAHVDEGAPLYEIETDKVEMAIDAPASGTVRWHVSEGEVHDVGTLVAEID